MIKIKRKKLDNGEHILYDKSDGHVLCYCESKTMAKLIRTALRLLESTREIDTGDEEE